METEDKRGQPREEQSYFTSEYLNNNPEIKEVLENPEDYEGGDIELLKILHQVLVTRMDILVNIKEKKKKIEDITTRNLILKELKKISDLLTE